jgi:hypothetical protein
MPHFTAFKTSLELENRSQTRGLHALAKILVDSARWIGYPAGVRTRRVNRSFLYQPVSCQPSGIFEKRNVFCGCERCGSPLLR